MPSPNKIKRVRGWAVMNVELHTPCISGNMEKEEVDSAAIFFSEHPGLAEKNARAWKKKYLGDKKFTMVKVLPITLTYSLPKKGKK